MTTPEEVQEVAKNMCGKILSCPESGEGFLCRCVYITEALDGLKEFYISVSQDRAKECPVITYGAWEGISHG